MTTTTLSTQQLEHGVGRCLATREKNGYDDSDFYGLFAVELPGGWKFQWVETGSTRFAGGFIPRVDCTDEAILSAYREQRKQVMRELAAERTARQAAQVLPGKPVTVITAVTRGKNKVEAGAFGTVLKRTENPFESAWAARYGTQTYRLLIDLGDRKVWIDEEKVRVTGHEEQPLPDLDQTVDYFIAGNWPSL